MEYIMEGYCHYLYYTDEKAYNHCGRAKTETPLGQLHICSGCMRDCYSWGQWPGQEKQSRRGDVQPTSTSMVWGKGQPDLHKLLGHFSSRTCPSLGVQPAARKHQTQGQSWCLIFYSVPKLQSS